MDALAIGLILLCFKMLYLNNQPMAYMNISTLLSIHILNQLFFIYIYLLMFYSIMLVWYNYKHNICNCSSLHLMTVWLSGKADYMDLIWCCMYFKESITILISANSSSITMYYLKHHLCSCVWKVWHSQCLQIINTALSFPSWCIYFSTYLPVLYIMYIRKDAVIIMLSTAAD